METNNHKIIDYDIVLDEKFGKEGTAERIEAENKAYVFYTSQILLDARKEAYMAYVLRPNLRKIEMLGI